MKEIKKTNEELSKITLKNEYITCELLNLGASIFSLTYNGIDIIVGPKNIDDFVEKDHHYGKTIGRFSGRLPTEGVIINDEKITLPSYKSDNSTIHGGKKGYARQYFNYVKPNDNEVIFTLLDKSSYSGLPGDVNIKITYKLIKEKLTIFYEAKTTEDTIVNVMNHSYFNLDGTKTILNHSLCIDAPKYVEFSPNYDVLGIKEVKGTLYDLTKPTLLKSPIEVLKESSFKGFDTIYLFEKNKKVQLYSELSKINLKIETDYPAVVVFTHNNPSPDNVKYFNTRAYHGIALECMYEPGGILSPYLNDGILKKGDKYKHFVSYELSKK